MSDYERLELDGLSPLPRPAERTCVVVDPIMLKRLTLLSTPAPPNRPPYEVPHFLNGWPVYLDPQLGEERGAILHADGRVEKFGRWS